MRPHNYVQQSNSNQLKRMMRLNSETVRYIHHAIPCTLAAAGYYLKGWLWIKCLVELWISITAFVMTGAFIMEFVCSLNGQQLQNHKNADPKRRVEEATESIRAFFVFSSFAAYVKYKILVGEPTALVFTLADAQPNAPENYLLYSLKLAIMTLLVDFYMYFKHRLLHWPPLFPFHKGHHHFHNPSPFGGFAVAPVEAVLTFSPVLFACLPQFPIFAQAQIVWVVGFVCLNLYLHSGWNVKIAEFILRPMGLNSSIFHNLHHEKTNTNFGELMYIWDKMLSTGGHPAVKY